MPIERKHRLPANFYHGQKTVAFTACTEGRQRFLHEEPLVEEFVACLKIQTDRFKCIVPIYCFMPDHLHVMIQGTELESRPKVAMDEFKRLTGTWLLSNRPGCRWQTSYYDHVIRKSDDWKGQAFYILNNPVRRGLVCDAFQYPFSGSLAYDLEELFAELAWS